MEIIGSSLQGAGRNFLGQLQQGQRLLVQVVSKTESGEGTILLEGNLTPAILETATKEGEKFWVTVRELNSGNLILVREFNRVQQFQETNNQESIFNHLKLIMEDLTSDKSIILAFLAENQIDFNHSKLIELRKWLWGRIPEWKFSEDSGAEQLLTLLKLIGINFEKRLQQAFKFNDKDELDLLRETLKYKVMDMLEHDSDQFPKKAKQQLSGILDELTAQQLSLDTDNEHVYILLNFPLKFSQKVIYVKTAIESARKGSKMDLQHSHFAVLTMTPNLGDIGVEAWFYQDTVKIKVLANHPNYLDMLLEKVKPITEERFARLGLKLIKVETGNIVTDNEFRSFIEKKRKSEVDYKI